MAEVSKEDLTVIITDPQGAGKLVEVADQLGKEFSRNLTTSQVRELFGEVRQIQAEWPISEAARQHALRRLVLLKPKMRYRARRERGQAIRELVGVLEPALDLVINERDADCQERNLHQFVEFFEAILAYHRAYGGN